MKKRLFSGIQPSGEIHIGNYLGAIKNWVALQETHDAIICVVDYHAITVRQNADEFRKRIFDTALSLMAAGIDPDKAALFVQSRVPEHTELAWILGTVIHMGHLERMTQYKQKAEQHPDDINVGLFTYPVLQTADIALYKAEVVPVGEDQVQHIELAREIVRRFNARCGAMFPEPEALVGTAARILGLDGKSKMSKSMNNTLGLVDSPETLEKKLRPAVTDVNRKRRNDPGNPEICNIYALHKHFSPVPVVDEINVECRRAGIGCIDCKLKLAGHMTLALAPVRERHAALTANPGRVVDALDHGAARCQAMARETMEPVRAALGVR
ncbi:MAG: tryptophan--tRNA ligase [Fibrobacterota bacterium]